MFENIGNFFKKMMKTDQKELLVDTTSKDAAKERLHIVLMQDRANVSADFLELMKQEIIDVIKKYIVIDEEQIDVRLTNQENEDGTSGAPSLYANIPILNIRNDIKGEVLGQNEPIFVVTDVDSEKVKSDTTESAKTEENKVDKAKLDKAELDTEEDDDVTFDDLLKAAEEEEKKELEERTKNKTKKTTSKSTTNTKPSSTTKGRTTSKPKATSKKKK